MKRIFRFLIVLLPVLFLFSVLKPAAEQTQESATPGDCNSYCYHQLAPEEQKCYLALLSGFMEMKADIILKTRDEQVIAKAFSAVLCDHPELFWVEGSYTGTLSLAVAMLRPDYNCTSEEQAAKQQQIDEVVDTVLTDLENYASDYEKAKYIFEYVLDHTEYQADAEDNQNLYSSLVNGKTVCAGYSRATQYLLQLAGLEALYVYGEIVDQGPHAWNVAKIDGEYYQIDATFGDRSFEDDFPDQLPGELTYDYTYLCIDDELMYRDRNVDPECMVPLCKDDSLNYFRLHGYLFDEYQRYDSAVRYTMIDDIESGVRYWRGQFTNEEAYCAMKAEVDDSWYAKMVRDYGNPTESTISTWCIYDDIHRVISLWY